MTIFGEFFPRIQHSVVQAVHKEWPVHISLIHHSVSLSSLFLPYQAGSLACAIGMWSGLILHIAHRFFSNLGSQAKKLELETKVLITKLHVIRNMQGQDKKLCREAKNYYDSMQALIDLAKEHLVDCDPKDVEELSVTIKENQHIADLLRERILRQERLHAELTKKCHEIRKIAIQDCVSYGIPQSQTLLMV